MDLHSSSKRTSSLASMSKLAGTTLATQGVAYSARKENAYDELEFIFIKITGPATDIMTGRYTKPRLLSSVQRLIEVHDDLGFLSSLFAKLLFQLTGAYVIVPRELWTINGKILERTNKLTPPSHLMDSAEIAFSNIRMWLDLLNHRFISRFQEVDA